MIALRTVLAASVGVVGVGGAVVALPAPASAHGTSVRRGDATAEVGPGHTGIRVCSLETDWAYAFGQWYTPGGALRTGDAVGYGQCWSTTSTGGIARYRVCLTTDFTSHTCSDWKRA
jgi:hypothetical protein